MFEDTQLASFSDALHEGFFVVGRHRHIVLWNRAARSIAGYRSEEILGRRCLDGLLVHVDGHGRSLCEHACPVARCLEDGGDHSTLAYLRHRDGYRLPVHLRTSPVRRSDGHVLGIAQVFQDAWDRVGRLERYADLRRLGMVDPATRLPNRRFLLKALGGHADGFRRYGWRYGVLLLGVDGDEDRIDPAGERANERVLSMTANTLAACVRRGDTLGRWGRREFLVAAEHLDSAELADLGERLRALVEASFAATSHGPLAATVSAGGTLALPGDDAESILRRTAACLRSAKGAGGNRVMVDLGQGGATSKPDRAAGAA